MRERDVIKSSGYRIGSFELESVIMEFPDEVYGQTAKATVVPKKGMEGKEQCKKEIRKKDMK